MTPAQRPRLYVSAIASLLVIIAIVFGILPLLDELQQTRQSIDATRSAIASMEKQQENIEAVSRDFAKITEDAKFVQGMFLREPDSVEFFNRIDEIFASTEISVSQVRIDEPTKKTARQLLGIHFTFAATFPQTLAVLRTFRSLTPLVNIETVSLDAAEQTGGIVQVTVDGTLPWEETI